MQNRKQRESLRMTRTYFLTGVQIRRLRENPRFFFLPGAELLNPNMLEADGEKSVLEEGVSGVLKWKSALSSRATQVSFRMGRLQDFLKLVSGSKY